MRSVDPDPHSQNDSRDRTAHASRVAAVAHFLKKTAPFSSSVHHARGIVAPCSIGPRDGGHGELAILAQHVVVPRSPRVAASPAAVTVLVTVMFESWSGR
jgi:hypothetical protein